MTSVLAGAEGCKFKRNLSEPPARGRAAGEQSRDAASIRAVVPQRTSYFAFEMAALRPTSASIFLDRGKRIFSLLFEIFALLFLFKSDGFDTGRENKIVLVF